MSTTPDSPLALVMEQRPEVRLNLLLENYLFHHPASPARAVVESAIATPSISLKMKVLQVILTDG